MPIYIGSIRPAKVDAARAAIEAAARIDERFSRTPLHAVDVTGVAPTMPMTERATLDGARLRAQALIERTSATAGGELLLAIGVEGGLDPLPGDDNRYVLKTWAAITDGVGWGFGAGGAIVLPVQITRAVLEGRELGEVIDELAGTAVRGTRGAWGVLTRDLIGRQDSFRSAIIAALAPFYNPGLYMDRV
jgi:inosine/xanthosine triphosphatase